MATASKSKTSSKTSEPAVISKLTVKSNKNKDTVSIANGTVQLQYWESILQDSIRASVVFTDTGNSLPKKRTLFGSSCLLYTSPSPRDLSTSRMPSSA